MKLATLRNGTRDGALAVVSRDLSKAVVASQALPAVKTLQQLMDDWDSTQPQVAQIYSDLNRYAGGGQGVPLNVVDFDPTACAAPLPRAYQWADGSAYVNHVELVRRARGAEMPASFWTDPLMYQGGSDTFLGPCDDIAMADEAWGIDLEGELAVITGDVPMGATPDESEKHIRMFMLVNDVSLRNLIPAELAKGFGFFHGKPSTAFAPVAITPDELGDAWRGGKVHLPLRAEINGLPLGRPDAGTDMTFSFPQLIAHAVKTRRLSAGSIVGSGTVSNKSAGGGPGKPVNEGGAGYTCLAEVRTVETILEGKPRTPFLKFGDRVRLEMLDASGRSIFGAIDQKVVRYER
jgi:fumarylacetoacetate (FAA) hydrolase